MTSFFQKYSIALLIFVAPGWACGARVEIKGVGTVTYDGGLFSPANPTGPEKDKGVALAKKSAWRNFAATLNPAKQQVIGQHTEAVENNLDTFITDFVIVDSYKNSDTKTLNVVVRVAFNDEVVDQFLAKLTIGDGQKAARSKDSIFSFLFMARKATSLTRFDARRTDVQQSDTQTAVSVDGALTLTEKRIKGGATLQTEDAVNYAVSSSQDLDAAMGEVFSTSGIEYVGYDDVVTQCDGVPAQKFRSEFVSSDELSPKTRAEVIKAARTCEVRYFAYGTIDTEIANVDPVTGSQRVYVSVRSQLWDISQKLPRKIGSVGPKQYSGLGPNQSVAGRNALSIAARDLAKTLVDQLNAKGIR